METPIRESVRAWILRALPIRQSDADLIQHLKSRDSTDLLIIYFNWIDRLIPAVSRRVHVSAHLNARNLSDHDRDALNQIIGDIEAGSALTRYLSRGVKIAAQMPTTGSLGKRRDIDLLLTQWRIHHLHLSREVDDDGFVKRPRSQNHSLLFGVFRDSDAYLLDVLPHDTLSFHDENILQIALEEFPQAQVGFEFKNVVGQARTLSQESHRLLRSNGVNSLREIGGRFYAPSNLISASGRGAQAVMRADHVMDRIEEFESFVKQLDMLRAIYLSSGVELPAEPEFEFKMHDEGWPVIWERNTKSVWPL